MSDALKNRLSLIRDKVNRSHLDNISGNSSPRQQHQATLKPNLTPAPSLKDLEARSFVGSLKRDATERKRKTDNLLQVIHQRNEESGTSDEFEVRLQKLRQHALQARRNVEIEARIDEIRRRKYDREQNLKEWGKEMKRGEKPLYKRIEEKFENQVLFPQIVEERVKLNHIRDMH